MTTTARQLATLTPDQRRALLAELAPADLIVLEHTWEFWARLDQLPPPGEWRTWILLGGRGSGKTRSSAEWIRSEMESGRRRNMAIVGPTADSVRGIMVEGPSGLLSICPDNNRPSYEPSTRRLVWPNGGIVRTFSAEEPERLRGPNIDGFWADELCAWANAETVWDMLQLSLRIAGPMGHPPCGVISTTPKAMALLRQILAAPSTVITRAKTSDNAANLDPSTLAYYARKYGGTRLGRQELDAELLTDLEGALWTRATIDDSRISEAQVPDWLRRAVVSVDPPGGSTTGHAECGIMVCAADHDGDFYVLADLSGRYTPEQWARRVVQAYRDYECDRIVAERNFGGAMVESTIRSVDRDVPVRMVTASRGKAVRAEPIAALYEQERVHHIGEFAQLEDQMCGWNPNEPGPSPDRVDALVWALTDLVSNQQTRRTVIL
jgi:phage terminase large subunit-like protein